MATGSTAADDDGTELILYDEAPGDQHSEGSSEEADPKRRCLRGDDIGDPEQLLQLAREQKDRMIERLRLCVVDFRKRSEAMVTHLEEYVSKLCGEIEDDIQKRSGLLEQRLEDRHRTHLELMRAKQALREERGAMAGEWHAPDRCQHYELKLQAYTVILAATGDGDEESGGM